MLSVKRKVEDIIKDAIKTAGYGDVESISVNTSSDPERGDFSIASAFEIGKSFGKNPGIVAKEIVDHISDDIISKAEVAGGGYVNIFLSEDVIASEIKKLLNGEFKFSSTFKGKKILLEHSSPNLFKPFHIGHLVNNTYGEALRNMLVYGGAEVTTISFPSDVSPGIAKAVWGLKYLGVDRDFSIDDVGRAYAEGVKAYDNDPDIKNQIDKINEIIYSGIPSHELEMYREGRKLSLDFFKSALNKLNSKIDYMIFESEAEREGKEIVKSNTPDIFEISEGAYIFRGEEKCGLYDNVFINSQGFGTYLAKDLGLLKIKFDRFDFDKSITITDLEQKSHFDLLVCAAGFVNEVWKEKSLYLQHGRMSPRKGKFSSRFGNVPLADEILNETIEAVRDKMRESGRGKESDAEKIALTSLKYGILKVTMGKPILWDKEKALSFEGDSGPYLLYSYVRAGSTIEKSNKTPEIADLNRIRANQTMRLALIFDEVLKEAIDELQPHKIANYANKLAASFNAFYATNKILDSGDDTNLAIAHAFFNIMKEVFATLGLPLVEKM